MRKGYRYYGAVWMSAFCLVCLSGCGQQTAVAGNPGIGTGINSSVAGPLIPQWVTSSAPSLRNLVAGIDSRTRSTTVPIWLQNAFSEMLNVKSDGTGVSILCPKSAKYCKPAARGEPPVVIITLSNVRKGLSLKCTSIFPCACFAMPVSEWCRQTVTPRRCAVCVKQSITVCESCERGNTQLSSCVTNRTPCASNHW